MAAVSVKSKLCEETGVLCCKVNFPQYFISKYKLETGVYISAY